MFDTMTVTKTVGGVGGALLVFLLANWAASSLYDMGSPEAAPARAEAPAAPAAEPEAPAAKSAPAETAADTTAGEAADEAPAAEASGAEPGAATLAAGDAEAGQKVFGKCKACHKIDGGNATGPHLDGVVGRKIASVDGFKYSTSMAEHQGAEWTPETLDLFLTNPKGFAANTKMSFPGLPKEEDRANLIAYLATLK